MTTTPFDETRFLSLLPGRAFRLMEETDSTFRAMRLWAREGAPDGAALLAEKQTAGRGRLGRDWASPRYAGLTFSYLMRPRLPASLCARLTPAVAVGVCRALREAGLREAGIKWPNDIVAEGRKLCGILCEMELAPDGKLAFVQAGIGLNVHPSPLPEELRQKAGFVGDYLSTTREELLARILPALDVSAREAQRDFPALLQAYRSLCVTLGKQVHASGGQEAEGLAFDINEECELLVRGADGQTTALRTADVSIRGKTGYV